MIPRFKPKIGVSELLHIVRFHEEKTIQSAEYAFCQLFSMKHAISFPYGRTALYTLLKALKFKNAEIICPAYTCVVVQDAIVKSGNIPVFIDSQESDFNMDLELVERRINQNTKMLIATSIFGYPVNLDKLKQIKKKHPDIFILQDCAHSFSAEWDGQAVQQVSDAAFVGMNISKIITSVFGGMLTTNDATLAANIRKEKLKLIQKPGLLKSLKRRIYLLAIYFAFSNFFYRATNWFERHRFLDRFTKYYDGQTISLPKDFLVDLTPFEAAIGNIQIKKYRAIVSHRQKIARCYDNELNKIKSIKLPPIIEGATYSHYTLRTNHRDKLVAYALKHGVQLGILIEYCVPEMPVYQKYAHHESFPVASKMATETINLPVTCSLIEAHKIVKVIKAFYQA